MAKKKTIFSSIDQEGNIIRTEKETKKEKRYNIPSEYFNLGMYFLVPILAGLSLGLWLDKRFDRKGFFTILLMFIGVIASFYNLYKLYKQDESAH